MTEAAGPRQISRVDEYRLLAQLEQSSTQLRYTTFTALIATSFVLPGLAARGEAPANAVIILGQRSTVPALAFLLGFTFFCFSVIHYSWYHRYAHKYRARLKALEVELGISVYRLRTRPTYRRAKFHFDWVLYIMGFSYLVITISFVGWLFTGIAVAVDVGLYGLLLLWSTRWVEEPLE